MGHRNKRGVRIVARECRDRDTRLLLALLGIVDQRLTGVQRHWKEWKQRPDQPRTGHDNAAPQRIGLNCTVRSTTHRLLLIS